MKHIILFLLVLTAFNSYSQERNFTDHQHETSPVYPGCENAPNRYDCYILKLGEAVRDKINLSAKDIAANDLQIELLLRNEKEGKTTILKLITDNPIAEKAAREALTSLPLIMPQPVNGVVGASSAGFFVNLHRVSSAEPFELVQHKKPAEEANRPHPGDFKIVMGIFPGCENVAVEDRKTCFSQNFREWLYKQLPAKIIRQSSGERATILLTFGKDGKMADYKIISKSKKLEEALAEVVKNCPSITPVEINGEKAKYNHSFPISF